MNRVTEPIAAMLKAAREDKQLSQRALSAKTGIPQGQISKIERGNVDLRVSSLVALARALDLELTLVPRTAVTVVDSIAGSSVGTRSAPNDLARQTEKELKQLRDSVAVATKLLPESSDIAQLRRVARDLDHFRVSQSDLKKIRNAVKAVTAYSEAVKKMAADNDMLKAAEAFSDSMRGVTDFTKIGQAQQALRNSISHIQLLRNKFAHRTNNTNQDATRLPAYSLDEDEDEDDDD